MAAPKSERGPELSHIAGTALLMDTHPQYVIVTVEMILG